MSPEPSAIRRNVIQLADSKIERLHEQQQALGSAPTLNTNDFILCNAELEHKEKSLTFMRKMMVEDVKAVFVQEALELFLMGIQRAHNELKNPAYIKTRLNLSNKSADPILQQQLDATRFMYFPISVPTNTQGIVVNTESIMDYAYFKSQQHDPHLAAPLKQAAKVHWIQLCQRITKAGMEEYYHAYQDFTPHKKQELEKQAIDAFGSVNAMLEKLGGLRRQRATTRDPEAIRHINAQILATDPWERDAERFRQPLEPESEALSNHYIEHHVLQSRGRPA